MALVVLVGLYKDGRNFDSLMTGISTIEKPVQNKWMTGFYMTGTPAMKEVISDALLALSV